MRLNEAVVAESVVPERPRSASLHGAQQQLRAAGLKVTSQRLAILDLLTRSARGTAHLSAEAIHDQLREQGRSISLATVYRVLVQLESSGLVARHHFSRGHCVFEIAKAEEHAHMLDIEGGEIVEFSDPIIRSRLQAIAAARGYDVVDQELILYVRSARV